MEKRNLKIKENITLIDKITAIESIVDCYFTYNKELNEITYTPYYGEMANVVAIVKNFIEGVYFEEDENDFDVIASDEEVMNLVGRFFYNAEIAKIENQENEQYINIFNDVMRNVYDIVEFKKNKLIHKNEELEEHMSQLTLFFESFSETFDVITNSLKNFSKLDLKALSPELIETTKKIAQKVNDGEFTINMFTNAIKDAVGFDMDKASAEIIGAKNQQILEKDQHIQKLTDKVTILEKYKRQNEAKNVLADKPNK